MGTVTFEKYLGQDGNGVKKTVFYKSDITSVDDIGSTINTFNHSEMYTGESADANAIVRSVEVYTDDTNTASDGVDKLARVFWGYVDEDTTGYDFTCTAEYADLIDGDTVSNMSITLKAVEGTKYATVVLVADSTANIN